MSKSTREVAREQELHVADVVQGSVQPNSGASRYYKGDVKSEFFLVECKTSMTPKKSYTIRLEDLQKNKLDTISEGVDYSVLAFDFGKPENKTKPREVYYVIDEDAMLMFVELLQEHKSNY